ncbi:MAG: SPFH domain-containing protein [Saprospiraceae bacterium]
MANDKTYTPINGYLMLLVILAIAAGIAYVLFGLHIPFVAPGVILVLFLLSGFFVVNPNGSRVMTLFGKYSGTVRTNGFFWTNPFYKKKSISLRARNFDSERLKVNDRRGNPIMISVILVWRVADSYKAAFEVDNYEEFVRVQTDAAVRTLAMAYSYDTFDDPIDGVDEITLRSNVETVNENLEREVQERLAIAGIEVLEARIGYLAYAEEIASAMLKRQQAEAVVAARHKIVEGAVAMVEDALNALAEKDVVHLDGEQRAQMVSNLMVVLCSDKETTPVVNTGTLYR